MKKLLPNILLTVTLVFAAFTCGFFLGRNFSPGQIQLTTLSASSSVRQDADISETDSSADAIAPNNAPASETEPETGTGPSEQITEATAAEASESTDAAVQTDSTAATTPEKDANGLININTATAATLMTLPGIGEVLAQRIVDYRLAHGSFKTVAELTNVKGIGEKKLEAIIALVTVG